MNFARRARFGPILQTQYSAEAIRICVWTHEFHAQPRFSRNVVEQSRRAPILCDGEIHTTVVIKVCGRRTTLFSVALHSGNVSRNRDQFAMAIAAQPKSAACLTAVLFKAKGKEVLAEKNIFVPI